MTTTPPSTNLRRIGVLGSTGVLATGSVAALLTALAGPAGAATTFTVNSNADAAADPTHCGNGSSVCTLRDAATLAADGDTITFDASLSGGTITLNQSTVSLQAVTLTGLGSSNLTITTTNAAGLYDAFQVGGTGNVTMSGFTLTKNRMHIDNDGDFTLDDVIVHDSEGSYGGALYTSNTGDAFITHSHFHDNTGTSKAGAVYIYNDGNATISDSEIVDNQSPNSSSGGIHVGSSLSGDFSLLRSKVTGNFAKAYAGGLYTDNGGDAIIVDSDISHNTLGSGNDSGGGVYASNDGALSITATTMDSNTAMWGGGALYISGSITDVTIANSTISNNTSPYAGGIVSWSGTAVPITITNSTITGNSATSGSGGGLYVTVGAVVLEQDTIVGNTAAHGGGVYLAGLATVDLSGTILSGNSAVPVVINGIAGSSGPSAHTSRTGSHAPASREKSAGHSPSLVVLPTPDDITAKVSSTVATSDHSLIGTIGGTAANLTITDVGGTIRSDTPGVDPLADNGGTTRTMALQTSSAAVDAGPNPVATFTGNDFDQRRTPWLRVYNGRVDIGAYELQPDPNPTTTTTAATEPVVPTFTG